MAPRHVIDRSLTLVEKVFSRAVGGVTNVRAGDIVFPQPDVIVCIDSALCKIIDEMEAAGSHRVVNSERVLVIADHDTPCTTRVMAMRALRTRNLAAKYQLLMRPPGNSGNSHILPVEEGLVGPGDLVFSVDTHSGNLGAVGAVAPCVLYEMSCVFATGTLWLKVPESVRVHLSGRAQPGVDVRDIADAVLREIGPDRADYRAIEFVGDYVAALSIEARMVLCNRPVEIGAKIAVVPPDKITADYLRRLGRDCPMSVCSDPDATFTDDIYLDVSELEPQIAVPPRPDCVVPISEVVGLPISHARIQGCSSGQLPDLRSAAAILAGRHIHPSVRMLIVPMTDRIYALAAKEGLLDIFVAAGATLMAPSCQICFGVSEALEDGDVCISTSPRNEPGRMGSSGAEIFLASPASVAASAIQGVICSPKHFLDKNSLPDL